MPRNHSNNWVLMLVRESANEPSRRIMAGYTCGKRRNEPLSTQPTKRVPVAGPAGVGFRSRGRRRSGWPRLSRELPGPGLAQPPHD